MDFKTVDFERINVVLFIILWAVLYIAAMVTLATIKLLGRKKGDDAL